MKLTDYEYNYYDAMKDDIKEYIKNEIDITEFANRDKLEEKLGIVLWNEDSITGNASGSYTCNAYQSEAYLCHNWDLLREALEEFGETDINPIEKGAEWCDVTIRCYLLPQVITETLDEMEENLEIIFDNNEEK